MKNSFTLKKQIDARYHTILKYDQTEIDNPILHHPRRLEYLDRIETIIGIIQHHFPDPDKHIRIGEFGCAQGNMSLILAEMGYSVFAIDIDEIFLEYSKLKYERGFLQWIRANFDDSDIPVPELDVAIAGEIVEHCAYPEDILNKIFQYVRPSGILIITTPNGARVKTSLPTFRQVSGRVQRERLVEKQFGPDGEHHLFLFRLEELDDIIPSDASILEKGYLGSTALINKYWYQILRFIPVRIIERVIRMLASMPIINKMTFCNIYAVMKKC